MRKHIVLSKLHGELTPQTIGVHMAQTLTTGIQLLLCMRVGYCVSICKVEVRMPNMPHYLIVIVCTYSLTLKQLSARLYNE